MADLSDPQMGEIPDRIIPEQPVASALSDRETFADAPKSISELRSDRSEWARDWSPRDTLIKLLREIDSGEVRVDFIVISTGSRSADGHAIVTDWRSAGAKNLLESVGLVARTLYRLNRACEPD